MSREFSLLVFSLLILGAFVLAFALAGCTAQPTRTPEARLDFQTVPVPKPVPCFTEDERPVLPPPTPVAEGATIDQIAKALQADIENEKVYANAVDNLFQKCLAAGAITLPKGSP